MQRAHRLVFLNFNPKVVIVNKSDDFWMKKNYLRKISTSSRNSGKTNYRVWVWFRKKWYKKYSLARCMIRKERTMYTCNPAVTEEYEDAMYLVAGLFYVIENTTLTWVKTTQSKWSLEIIHFHFPTRMLVAVAW